MTPEERQRRKEERDLEKKRRVEARKDESKGGSCCEVARASQKTCDG